MTVTFVVEAMAAANAVRRKTRLELLKQVNFVYLPLVNILLKI